MGICFLDAARFIVNAILIVHRALGSGLLESAYQQCLAHELRKRGLTVELEVVLPIHYDGIQVELIGICFLDAARFNENCFCAGFIFREHAPP